MATPALRIVAVHLRALPLEAIFAHAPPAQGEAAIAEEREAGALGPCAVREMTRGRGVLAAVSEAARCAGVRPGMSEAEGRATFAGLTIRDRDPALELAYLERAAELLFAYGPEVEVCPPATLFVEVGRSRSLLRRRFGRASEHEVLERLVRELAGVGHAATAALADDPDTARTFAEHLSRQLELQAGSKSARPRSGGAGLGASLPQEPGNGRARASKKRGRRSTRPEADPRAGSPSPDEAAREVGGATKPRSSPPAGGSAAQEGSAEGVEARIRVVPPGGSRAALAALPIEALAWTDLREDPEGRLRERLYGACAALRSLGVTTVRALAGFRPEELGARFGEAGARLADRMRGARMRPLRGYAPPERVEESFELEAPTEALEPIVFVLRRLLHRLEARLAARQLAAAGLTVDLVLEPGLERAVDLDTARAPSSKRREVIHLRLARPTRSSSTLLAVVRERIGGALPGAVLGLRVVAEDSERAPGAQLDLFSRRAQKAEALAELVGRLSAALGDSAVFSPRMRDTHRPEAAWAPERFSVDTALAALRAPRPASARRAQQAVLADAQTETRALPEVDERLSVVAPAEVEDPEAALPDAAAWPKPRPRRPEDEPVAPLPPRPAELLEVPEPASLLEDGGVLLWRGRRARVRERTGREHLSTEWWRPKGERLERDYVAIETEDGRALWIFTTPEGATYVHGIFD